MLYKTRQAALTAIRYQYSPELAARHYASPCYYLDSLDEAFDIRQPKPVGWCIKLKV